MITEQPSAGAEGFEVVSDVASEAVSEAPAEVVSDVASEAAAEVAASLDGIGTVVAIRARGRARVVGLAILGAVTVVFGSFGIWASVAAHGLRSTAASANSALVDRSGTAAVSAAVTRAVEEIFSYDYADVAKTRAAAQGMLTGAAIRQYDELFALVERQAPKEKLVVTTKVSNVGVELLAGGQARVLVFANQEDTRAGTSQTSYGGAMFAVTVVHRDGRWLIESIDTFTSPSG